MCFKLFKKKDLGNFKQETLVKHFLKCHYDAHNAAEDVKLLKRLFVSIFIPKLTSNVITGLLFHFDSHLYKKTFDDMISQKAISKMTAKKLAEIGLSFDHIKLCFERGGRSAIEGVFCEEMARPSQVRISKSKSIIENVISYLCKE